MGKEITELLIETGKISGRSLKLFDSEVPFFTKSSVRGDVPVSIVYASKLDPTIAIDKELRNDNFVSEVGDNFVNREGLEWICTH
jgi:hypothetical protein